MAHASAVVSIDWVSHDNGDFLISASTDHTAKMWDLKGQCVGTFGQVSIATIVYINSISP